MPADLIKSGVNLDLLEPNFRDSVFALLAACRARGKNYLVLEGYRSWGRSHQLYAKYLQGGPRAAPAGYSAHNYGLAVDCALIINPSPKRVVSFADKDFDVLVEEALRLGLAAGLKNDRGHVGLKGYESAQQLEKLKRTWNGVQSARTEDRLKAVWATL